jgi:hypothetical protein
MQFLDAVHQLCAQHPHAFEFTPLLLATLGYHTTSMRFATFLFDSLVQRDERGTADACVWEHIDSVHKLSPQVCICPVSLHAYCMHATGVFCDVLCDYGT